MMEDKTIKNEKGLIPYYKWFYGKFILVGYIKK